MADYRNWKHIFQTSWCPILGEIPGNDHHTRQDEPLPHDPLDTLALIIKESRELLEVDFLDPALFEHDHPSLDVPKHKYAEVIISCSREIEIAAANAPSPTLGYVKLIRAIYGSTRSICQYLEYYENNKYIQQVINSARDVFHLELPGFIVMGVLAIKVAYTQAQRLVVYDEPADTSVPIFLLGEAQKKVADKEIRHLAGKVNLLEPLATNFNKQSSGFQRSNKESNSRSRKKEKTILKWANEISKENFPEKVKNSFIADAIIKRIERSYFPEIECNTVLVIGPEGERDKIPSRKSIQNILSRLTKSFPSQ